MSELIEYASGVESVLNWSGETGELTIEVDANETPDRISIAFGTSAGDRDGIYLDIERAQELMVALQGAIDTAKLNRRRM